MQSQWIEHIGCCAHEAEGTYYAASEWNEKQFYLLREMKWTSEQVKQYMLWVSTEEK